MKKVVTLGEIMLRLKSPGLERFMQSPALEATFGGSEVNVAVSLANFGMDAKFVTALPEHDITSALVRELRGFGVDVSDIVYTDGRLGVYFLETGSNSRPSKVIYDRAGSAMALSTPDTFDFDKIFEDAEWFHISGITPALSQSAADVSLAAVKAAKEKGITVSCDLNYRKNLWKYGKESKEIMSELVKYVDVIMANEEACRISLGIETDVSATGDDYDKLKYETLAKMVLKAYPNASKITFNFRESKSADHNDWSACIYDGETFYVSKKYEIKNIVDRVGGGDSFAGGLIYGLNNYSDVTRALEFAVAASCLKHTIPGDYNRVSVKEVEFLMDGDGSGRVQR